MYIDDGMFSCEKFIAPIKLNIIVHIYSDSLKSIKIEYNRIKSKLKLNCNDMQRLIRAFNCKAGNDKNIKTLGYETAAMMPAK